MILLLFIQQQRVYDRRTSQDKTSKAVKLSASVASTSLNSNPARFDEDGDVIPAQDDIVALVKEDSTRESPQILLGKVLRVNTPDHEREVLLPHLHELEMSKFRRRVGRSTWTWTESFDSLVYPVDVAYDNSAFLCHFANRWITPNTLLL